MSEDLGSCHILNGGSREKRICLQERIGLDRSAQWVAYWVYPGDADVFTYSVEDCTEGSGRFPGAREAAKPAAVRRGPSADYSPKVREIDVHKMGGGCPHREGIHQGGARKSFPLQSRGHSVLDSSSCLSGCSRRRRDEIMYSADSLALPRSVSYFF